jgi:DNA polymerase-3 subunit delta
MDKTHISRVKYTIEPKATAMLVNFGNELEKINNELQKLQIILPIGS